MNPDTDNLFAKQLDQAYAELDLKPGAAPDEIRDAYHRLARALHPDLNPGASGALMSRVNAAYNVLLRQVMRQRAEEKPAVAADEPRAYDFQEFQQPAAPQTARPARPEPAPQARPRQDAARPADQVELPPPGFSGWRLMGLSRQAEGLVYRVAVSGDPVEITLPVRSQRACAVCRGTGRLADGAPCRACGGRGHMVKSDMVSIPLPPDWFPGQKLNAAPAERGEPLWVELLACRRAGERA